MAAQAQQGVATGPSRCPAPDWPERSAGRATPDARDLVQITHPMADLLRERVFAITC